MAVWVDCHGVPAFFSGWGCDMGPYIGPWPLLPPGELTGLGTDEIDFYVALPNPSAPTDVTVVADYSYDTAIWDAFRYATGSTPPTSFGYSGAATGPSAPFPIPATMPAGMHLYVVAGTTSAPTNPPEFYVPASYAAGGAAAFETAMGHWSTDQAAYDKATTVADTSGPTKSGSETVTSGSDLNVNTTADSLLSTLLSDPSPGGGIGGTIRASKQSGTGTTVSVFAESIVKNYDASALVAPAGSLAYPHAVLDPLIYRQDYSQTPYIDTAGNPGLEYAFDDPTTIGWTWGTLTFTGDNTIGAALGGTMPSDYTAFDIPIRVGWATGALSGTPAWTYTGTTLGDYVGAVGAAQNPSFTIDMSAVNQTVFHLYWGEKFLYTGATGATNFAQPLAEADYVRTVGAAIGGNLPLTVHFPTWRYWIPGDIVPTGLKWHTVGGHFATVGPAGLKILTPGRGWVAVVDGPA